MSLVDDQGRRINYLRLSVTDRCNLRCKYCMPAGGIPRVDHESILRYEELLDVTRAALSLGVEKVRVTGGEPLVRKGIIGFLRQLSSLHGLQRLVLTTNGVLLSSLAEELRDAGVQSLNVSLDSLHPQNFAQITRGGELRTVQRGIRKALSLDMPIKINVVVMRDVNDQEILDFVRMADEMSCTVRFIEFMPVLNSQGWQRRIVPGSEILERISKKYDLIPVVKTSDAGPAAEYHFGFGGGKIGVITPMSGHFCGSCNRIRVTAKGMARACLFSEQETNLKPFLRGEDTERLRQCMQEVIKGKPLKHEVTTQGTPHTAFSMAGVGG